MFVPGFIRSEPLQSIIWAVDTSEDQFVGNDGLQIWLEKIDCLYLILTNAAMDKPFVNCLKLKDS